MKYKLNDRVVMNQSAKTLRGEKGKIVDIGVLPDNFVVYLILFDKTGKKVWFPGYNLDPEHPQSEPPQKESLKSGVWYNLDEHSPTKEEIGDRMIIDAYDSMVNPGYLTYLLYKDGTPAPLFARPRSKFFMLIDRAPNDGYEPILEFDGEEAIIEATGPGDGTFFSVHCPGCSVELSTVSYSTPKDAVEAWNKWVLEHTK